MRELATAGFTFAAGIAAAHWLLPAAWLFPAAAALVLPLLAGIFLLRGLARRRCVIICCFAALGAVEALQRTLLFLLPPEAVPPLLAGALECTPARTPTLRRALTIRCRP